MSCKFAESLGRPNEGAHRYNAVLDWVMTLVIAGVLGFATSKLVDVPPLFAVFLWFVVLYLLAIFLHWVFCVKSRVSVFLRLVKN